MPFCHLDAWMQTWWVTRQWCIHASWQPYRVDILAKGQNDAWMHPGWVDLCGLHLCIIGDKGHSTLKYYTVHKGLNKCTCVGSGNRGSVEWTPCQDTSPAADLPWKGSSRLRRVNIFFAMPFLSAAVKRAWQGWSIYLQYSELPTCTNCEVCLWKGEMGCRRGYAHGKGIFYLFMFWLGMGVGG